MTSRKISKVHLKTWGRTKTLKMWLWSVEMASRWRLTRWSWLLLVHFSRSFWISWRIEDTIDPPPVPAPFRIGLRPSPPSVCGTCLPSPCPPEKRKPVLTFGCSKLVNGRSEFLFDIEDFWQLGQKTKSLGTPIWPGLQETPAFGLEHASPCSVTQVPVLLCSVSLPGWYLIRQPSPPEQTPSAFANPPHFSPYPGEHCRQIPQGSSWSWPDEQEFLFFVNIREVEINLEVINLTSSYQDWDILKCSSTCWARRGCEWILAGNPGFGARSCRRDCVQTH